MSDTLFNKVTGTFPSSTTFYGESWDGSTLSSTTEWRKVGVLSGGTTTTWCKNTEPFWIMFPQGGTFTLTLVGTLGITACTLMIYTKDSSGNFVAYSPITASSEGTVSNQLAANTKYYLIKSGTKPWATGTSAYHRIIIANTSATIGGDVRSVVLNTTNLSAGTFSDLASITNYYSSTTNFFAANMFLNATGIIDASRLEFPENDLYADNACYQMFQGCTGLVLPPIELPAKTPKDYMYRYMFYNCNNLTKTPIIYLTAPTRNRCMQSMFSWCYHLGRVYLKCTDFTYTNYGSYQWLTNSGGSATNGRHFYITSGVTPATDNNGCPSSFTLHNSASDNINTLFPY